MLGKFRKTLLICALLAFSSSSTPSQALSTDQLLELAIDLVNPDLQPFRPAILCTVKGGTLESCATGQAKAELEKNDDYQRITKAYGLARDKKYAALVSQFGVAAVCTTFSGVPGTEIVCSEFGQKIAEAGEYALNKAGQIVTPAGNAALQWISKNAGKFGCAIGFYCPKETNPNEYLVDLGPAGSFSLNKFDLKAIWLNDYQPRIKEGILARTADSEQWKRMMLPAMTYHDRYLLLDQLGAKSVNKLAGENCCEGPEWLYKAAFEPFQKELNGAFADIVFKAAASEQVDAADRFAQSTGNLLKIKLPVMAEELFDRDLPSIVMVSKRRILSKDCYRTVILPTHGLRRWAEIGLEIGDSTPVNGKGPDSWAKIGNWCDAVLVPALDKEIAERKAARAKALAGGCTSRPGGAKGLVCPPMRVGGLLSLAGPMASCHRAYRGSEAAYCIPSAARAATPVIQPANPPPPAPAPSPSPSPRIKTKILLPGS